MDKTSGVTPIAAGAIKGRIGRLTSAAALRVTLLALLAKTEKKRTTYGAAIAQMCELSLAWLDRAGLFRTTPDERRVEIHWPSPLPENELEKLQEAEVEARLGVPKRRRAARAGVLTPASVTSSGSARSHVHERRQPCPTRRSTHHRKEDAMSERRRRARRRIAAARGACRAARSRRPAGAAAPARGGADAVAATAGWSSSTCGCGARCDERASRHDRVTPKPRRPIVREP